MTNATIAQPEPVLVAIDIAKARHEVLIAVPDKKRRRRLTVLNQLDDFDQLVARPPALRLKAGERPTTHNPISTIPL